MPIVDVVIVTYNRLEKLKKALACYSNQTVPFRCLIVVDNHSTDGTETFLASWRKQDTSYEKTVIRLDSNMGGSGGFYAGQKYALSRNPDWIFLADDDAYPSVDTMEKFHLFIQQNYKRSYGAICGTVISPQGNICYPHRAYENITKKIYFEKRSSEANDYEKHFFSIDFFSYVGVFLNAKALVSVGLVNPSYFIYHDDAEHSLRLKKFGEIVCVPAITITHDTWWDPTIQSQVNKWRDYYFLRNQLHMLLKHHPLCALNNIRFYIKQMMLKRVDVPLYRRAIYDAITNHLGANPDYMPVS